MNSAALLSEQLRTRTEETGTESSQYTPVIYRPADPGSGAALAALLQKQPDIRVFNNLHSQLIELVKAKTPSKIFSAEEADAGVKAHLNGIAEDDYGAWVYYPWANRLVHILDETEFVMLRTNRNKYKITDAEREALSEKRIGVIGLSVGQSVSVTLAMERSFGELRIADFDELEITNLNRLRSGVHNMGLKKTVLVAREICELDPYLKVTCYHEGITEENLERFLTEGGKLDLLIDECDSVNIKVLCRTEAKRHGIPVVMEGSDRATIDVERFDLEPDRPILHGYLSHLDLTKLKDLRTSEEKLPYMLPIAGVETLSARMKASALEVGQSINTWPQLASAVTMGGGITADVARRILLDQYHGSGRYFVDIEELIGDGGQAEEKPVPGIAPLNWDEIRHIITANTVAGDGNFPEEILTELVRAAAIAPSAGNNQPWKWYHGNGRLWLFHDHGRAKSFGNFQNMASYMALGTALENLSIRAHELGQRVEIALFPLEGRENPVAEVRPGRQFPRSEAPEMLNSALMRQRHTNRIVDVKSSISEDIFRELEASVKTIPGAAFHYVTSADDLAVMADVIGTSERLRVFIPQGHYELFENEFRWTAEDALEAGDGLDMDTFEFTVAERFGLRLARDPKVGAYLRDWDGGKGLEKIARKSVNNSAAIGLVSMSAFTPENCVLAGRAAERIWLTATRHGLAFQPMLAPLLHFARILYSPESAISPDIERRFMELYENFRSLRAFSDMGRVPMFLFRIGYAREPKTKSYRLALDEIFRSGGSHHS